MAKTRRKDIIRNILKQLVSWLSIIVISSFAVTAYLGLTYSARALARAGQDFYESTNYHDIQVTSNCLLSEEDLNSIAALEGINAVEGIYRVNARISTDKATSDILIYSLPEQIDLPIIKEGNLPSEPTDCMLEENLASKLGLKIGDIIEPLDAYDEELPEINYDSFRLTGIFIHAEHSTFDLDETYCLIVKPEAFDKEQFDDCYPLANITVDQPTYRSFFSQAYFDHVEQYLNAIEDLGKSLSEKRYGEHLAFLEDQITDSRKELKDAKSQLDFVGRTIPSLNSKTGDVTADLSNMLSVLIYEDPSEYKTAGEQSDDYYEAVTAYENALKKVDDAQKNHDKLISGGKCIWYVFNRNSSLDFVNLRNNSENLENLNMSFSVLFVVIAIMVIFASLSRMVQEQRTLIGISKAIGLHFHEIFSKYFTFGFSASMLGIGIGILLSLYVIELVIAIGYEDHFVFGRFPFLLDIYPTIAAVLIAITISVISIYLSCNKLMRQTAKKLLSPVVPKGQSKELKKSSLLSGLSLYNRMILLNVRSDLGRVIVTIISIAGCCSLIVIGFTLKWSIAGCLTRQVSEFVHYDGIVKLNTSLYEDAAQNVGKILSDRQVSATLFLHLHGSIQIEDTMEYSEFLISDEPEKISAFHPLIDFKTGKEITEFPKEGILITNRLSETYNLKSGDTINLIDSMGYKHSAKIGGIIKNYIGRYIIITKSYYEEIMDNEFKDNAYFIRVKNTEDLNVLLDELSIAEGYESYSSSEDLTKTFDNLLIVLNLIVVLLIVLSGIMAMFVLLNLANMYLMSKRTELVIMRVNGFTVSETVRYAIREVIFTTTLGIIFGVAFGILMAYSILRNMELVHLMFVRTPSVPSCVFGALITAIFTAAIYAFSMRKVKDMSLKDFLT